MRYFYDTEFHENGPREPIRPISIGIVAEDGREYYAQFIYNWEWSTPWLIENVLPHIGPRGDQKGREVIASELTRFLRLDEVEAKRESKPELYGYFSDYDHIVLCQIWKSMNTLPTGMPYYTRDLKQLMWHCKLHRSDLPPDPEIKHNALQDARWIHDAFYHVLRTGKFQQPVELL